MCDRECLCKECIKVCTCCKHNESKLDECRHGGIKKCKHFKKRHASGQWTKFLIPRRITTDPVRLYRWLNFYHRFKDKGVDK